MKKISTVIAIVFMAAVSLFVFNTRIAETRVTIVPVTPYIFGELIILVDGPDGKDREILSEFVKVLESSSPQHVVKGLIKLKKHHLTFPLGPYTVYKASGKLFFGRSTITFETEGGPAFDDKKALKSALDSALDEVVRVLR